MATIIYTLCTFTAMLCAVLLLQAYHRGRYSFLLWSGLCFIGLTVNNALVVVDKFFIPDISLSTLRLGSGLLAMLVLLYGLIWKVD